MIPGRPERQGEDLLDHIKRSLSEEGRGEGPGLTIVVGPAGAGKSVLFEALFSTLYNHFQAEKKQDKIFRRPIPLLPQYLERGMRLGTQELIESFLRTEVAIPVPRPTFEWMLINGFSMWLWDGLDELYTGDPEFFPTVEEVLTRPGSKAQLLICARHSLLANEAFANFQEEYGGDPNVRIYRLDDWAHGSKRIFAWLQILGRRPENGKPDPAPVAGFLSAITRSEPLRRLSGLPYYCALLLEEFRRGELPELRDDFEIIERVVSHMIEREYQKGLVRPEQLEPGGLEVWLEEAALDCLANETRGIPTRYVEELGELVLRGELTTDERQNVLLTLKQFPLFEPGLAPGTVTFKHELIAEYLAGRYLSRRFAEDPSWVARNLGTRSDLAGSMIARYLVRKLGATPSVIQTLREALRTLPLPGRQFPNLLQILLMATPDRNIIQEGNFGFEGRDLSHVEFSERSLRDISFRGCVLTGTIFRACDLRAAKFEGALLIGTRFENLGGDALRGARFGDLDHFEYIFVDRQRIDDFHKAVEWVADVTGHPRPIKQPCPAALQLTVLFQKFVYPDGTGRRDELPLAALYRGKRYAGAPTPEECVRAAIRFAFLQEPDWRDRVRRSPGDRYNQIVYFVKERRLAAEMRQLLDSLCPMAGCEHLP
jgi:hypothetical protein